MVKQTVNKGKTAAVGKGEHTGADRSLDSVIGVVLCYRLSRYRWRVAVGPIAKLQQPMTTIDPLSFRVEREQDFDYIHLRICILQILFTLAKLRAVGLSLQLAHRSTSGSGRRLCLVSLEPFFRRFRCSSHILAWRTVKSGVGGHALQRS